MVVGWAFTLIQMWEKDWTNEYQFRDKGMIKMKFEEVYVGSMKQSHVYM